MDDHFTKWANSKGYTLVLSGNDIGKLIDALKRLKGALHEEVFEDLDINYSPILDEAEGRDDT